MLIWAHFHFLSFTSSMSFLAVIVFVLLSGEVFHSSYHLHDEPKSHPDVPVWMHRLLIKLPFYRKLQLLHDIHHGKNNANFGFVDFQFDMLFGERIIALRTTVAEPPKFYTLIYIFKPGTYCEDTPTYVIQARSKHKDAHKYKL